LDLSMGYRRVVTAKDQAGKSVFIADEVLEPLTLSFLPGVEFYRFGGGDEPPYVGPGAAIPTYHEFFAGPGGYRFLISTIPAGQTVRAPASMDKKAVLAEVEAKLPGLLHASEREPGMHTSATVDFVIVLDGRVGLELDDGARVELSRGDVVQQIGARHRWSNLGTETAVTLSAIIGGNAQPPPTASDS
jgi:hypothetical protein